MSKTPEVQEETVLDEVSERLFTQDEVIAIIEKYNARVHQGFMNSANALSSILNQFADQAQTAAYLAMEEAGVELPPEVQAYKDLMLAEEVRLETEAIAQAEAASDKERAEEAEEE